MKQSQSLAGYIRQHLAELEIQLEHGVRQEVLVAELAKQGYQTTPKVFRNLLYRARIWAAKKAALSPVKTKEKTYEENVETKNNKSIKNPDNPITKSKGFTYKTDIDHSDLI